MFSALGCKSSNGTGCRMHQSTLPRRFLTSAGLPASSKPVPSPICSILKSLKRLKCPIRQPTPMRTSSQRMIENPILVPRPIFQPSANRNRGRLIQCGNIIAEICRDALKIFPILGWVLRRFFAFLLGKEFLFSQDLFPSRNCVHRTNWREPGEEDLGSAQPRPVDHGVRSSTSSVHQATSPSSGAFSDHILPILAIQLGNAKGRLSFTICKTWLYDRNT
jgi:hypothetical protein